MLSQHNGQDMAPMWSSISLPKSHTQEKVRVAQHNTLPPM